MAVKLLKKPKSASLTESEVAQLKQLKDEYKTQTALALDLGVDRTVITRMILSGSGHPDYVEKIRKGLAKFKNKLKATA